MVCKKGINVVNVAAKTINLAKEPIKKRPLCPIPGMPPIPPPPASHIRVCTPEQLRSICPPEPCVCPEPPRPLTGGERLFKVIVLLSKWLFLLGFMKWTDDLGIWGNSQSTAQLRGDAYKRLEPILKPKVNESESEEDGGKKKEETPSEYGFTYNMATMWNNAVGNTFYVIGVLPATALGKAFTMVNTKKEEPPPPPPPDPKDKTKKKVSFVH